MSTNDAEVVEKIKAAMQRRIDDIDGFYVDPDLANRFFVDEVEKIMLGLDDSKTLAERV